MQTTNDFITIGEASASEAPAVLVVGGIAYVIPMVVARRVIELVRLLAQAEATS